MPPSPSGTRARAGLFLALTVIAALFSMAVAQRYVRNVAEQREGALTPNTVDVVVATRTLYVGQAIEVDDIALRQVPKSAAPEKGVFHTLDEVRGRTPRERVLGNELIREERLARPDAGIGLNAIVTPGLRAMTLAVTTENAVAGLLRPSNYVDIILTIRPDDADDKNWYSKTILEAIKVLAVGTEFGDGETTGTASAGGASKNPNATVKLRPSITLELTAAEAESLALATSRGDINVVLRSDIDTTINSDRPGVTVGGLIPKVAAPTPPAGPRSTAPEKKKDQTWTGMLIEVWNGGKKTEQGVKDRGAAP